MPEGLGGCPKIQFQPGGPNSHIAPPVFSGFQLGSGGWRKGCSKDGGPFYPSISSFPQVVPSPLRGPFPLHRACPLTCTPLSPKALLSNTSPEWGTLPMSSP